MSAKIIDGKAIAEGLIARIKKQVDSRLAAGQRPPGLAMVLVGDHPASKVYVNNKERSSRRCGIRSFMHRLPASTDTDALLDVVERLNSDPDVDGILVQLPLPEHIDAERVIESIDPDKDADGFHPYNMGRLAQGRPGPRPCTPRGVMTLLAASEVDPTGADAVVIGRSNIVGRPMALEFVNVGATVTVCHSRTRDLADKAAAADILVAAVGRAEFVRGDWVKRGAVVIDVGINRRSDGTLAGDVDFDGACRRARLITPVPGGVGPMTVATLLQNTLESNLTGCGG